MKIILTSIGTRGDIEPFIAIGKFLKERGHQVICAFSEQFRDLTESFNLEFVSFGKKLDELSETDAARTLMGGGSGINKFLAIIKLARNQKGATKEKELKLYELIKQERPDRIVYHSSTVYPVLWECQNRGKTILVSPFPCFHYVKGHAILGFSNNYGEFFNKLTFKLYDFGAVMAPFIFKKMLKIKDKITLNRLKNIIQSRKFIYTISPGLFPRPGYWKDNVKILGHQELKRTTDWKPEKKLTEFIKKYEKILFITFGSMVNPEPELKTKIILEILERNKIPAIINTADGGLIKPEKFNSELIYFVSQIPYDWIFPKVYAVIHHGGSGTTHLVIKYGCATMIIPHLFDQFVWDKIISDLGVGPKGIKISKMNNPAASGRGIWSQADPSLYFK